MTLYKQCSLTLGQLATAILLDVTKSSNLRLDQLHSYSVATPRVSSMCNCYYRDTEK